MSKGFTLIEIIIVIALISILVSITVPSLSGYKNNQISSDLNNELRYTNALLRQYYVVSGVKIQTISDPIFFDSTIASKPIWVNKLANEYRFTLNESYEYRYLTDGLYGEIQVRLK